MVKACNFALHTYKGKPEALVTLAPLVPVTDMGCPAFGISGYLPNRLDIPLPKPDAVRVSDLPALSSILLFRSSCIFLLSIGSIFYQGRRSPPSDRPFQVSLKTRHTRNQITSPLRSSRIIPFYKDSHIKPIGEGRENFRALIRIVARASGRIGHRAPCSGGSDRPPERM